MAEGPAELFTNVVGYLLELSVCRAVEMFRRAASPELQGRIIQAQFFIGVGIGIGIRYRCG